MTNQFALAQTIAQENAFSAWEQVNTLIQNTYGSSLDTVLEEHDRNRARPRARIRFEQDYAKSQALPYRRSIRKYRLSKDAYVLELFQNGKWAFNTAWHPSRNKDTLPSAALERICEMLSLGYDLTE